MTMKESDKDRMRGMIAAVIFHVVLICVFVFSKMHYVPLLDKISQPEEEILFGGEYVMLGDILQPMRNDAPGMERVEQSSKEPAMAGEDTENVGETGDAPTPMVSTDAESPMKVKKEEKPGPTAEELAEAERVKKEQEQKAKKINKRVTFGKTEGTGSGTGGSPDGVSTARVASGAPGVSGLEGYTLSNWGRPNSAVNGVVRIRVRVNSRGKVTEAKYEGGSGSAAGNQAVRRSCERAALQSQFSVPKNTTTDGVGVITWKFE